VTHLTLWKKLTNLKKFQILEWNLNLNLNEVAKRIWYCLIHWLFYYSTLHFQLTISILSNIVIVYFMNLAFLWFYVQSNHFQDLFWILLSFLFLFLLQRYLVHDFNLDCTSKNPNLTIIFFHGIAYGIYNEWKETRTTRPITHKEKCICQPQMWTPKDLNDNVIILSLSYDYSVVVSVHNDMTKIGRNLVQRVIDSRFNNILICGHLFFHCVFQ
jgi:small-conductance mechanosensitive channel